MNSPIFDYLIKYIQNNPTSFHMPGHKSGTGLPPDFISCMSKIDVTEIPGTDNLHSPEGIILEAQNLAAKAFGSNHTFFLINGSTCGIHAAIMSICNKGDKLIVARNCHQSVISGLFLAEVEPVFIKPEFNSEFGISTTINPKTIKETLISNPNVKGVIITSPNYYGICCDIKGIAKEVHKLDKILIVDEAHGAHLKFSDKLPPCGLESGADICIQSAHKTLPALTQASYLHIKSENINIEKLKLFLNILQSSSPSYILMSSLDIARKIMEESGQERLENLITQIDNFKARLNKLSKYKVLDNNIIINGSHDSTRLVINVRRLGISGYEAELSLREKHAIQIEMSDLYNIVCIFTISNTPEDFSKLLNALSELHIENIDRDEQHLPQIPNFQIPKKILPLSKAITSENELIDLRNCKNRISASTITPYPPGVPIVIPGEVIDAEIINYLEGITRLGGKIFGIIGEDKLRIVKQKEG